MEIDVSALFDEDCGLLSGSVAELGENAGPLTWRNCQALAGRLPILATDETREEIRKHFREYGAWTDEEINAWTDLELSALVWQEAAAEMREFEELCDSDPEEYRRLQEQGTLSGRLFIDGKKAFFYIGM